MARQPGNYVNGEARAFLVRRDGAVRGLLWGTWHVEYDEATVMPRAVRQRFSGAGRLVVEQVWDEVPASARRTLGNAFRRGLLGSSPAALAGLDADTRAALAEAGVTREELGQYSLVGLAGLAGRQSAPAPGLLPQGGIVDQNLIGFARSVSIPVDGLEQPDPDVLRRLFFADTNGADAADTLRLALRRRTSAEAFQEWLRAHYSAGQIGPMVAVMTAWQATPADLKRADRARAGLLTQRNLAWMPQFERVLNGASGKDPSGRGRPVFAAFGAAHLTGTDGVVALLRGRGWAVDACVGDRVPGPDW